MNILELHNELLIVIQTYVFSPELSDECSFLAAAKNWEQNLRFVSLYNPPCPQKWMERKCHKITKTYKATFQQKHEWCVPAYEASRVVLQKGLANAFS